MEKIKLLLCCTKQPLYLVRNECDGYFYTMDKRALNDYKNVETYNGKIVAECDFEVEEIEPFQYQQDYHSSMETGYETKTTCFENLLKKSGLTHSLIDCYLRCDIGYAIHIKNLHIFDKPKELTEYGTEISPIFMKPICYAPQNMMYCIDKHDNKYVLISVRPEWLCKILNGEKTIEVRKKVLKEMMQNA